MRRFQHAVVRDVGANFADALSTSGLGAPSSAVARRQHDAYCAALKTCGLALTRLPADARYPDGVFVEDTAIIDADRALIARPGHISRRGEAVLMAPVLAGLVKQVEFVRGPGTIDGGDVCDAGEIVFVGRSSRTNDEGIEQLRRWAAACGKRTVAVELARDLLHLKSGLAYIGNRTFMTVSALAGHPALDGFAIIPVDEDEAYAANCVWVNGRILVADGYPKTVEALCRHGFDTLTLEVGEFAKMDGGLSCLSLRF